MDACSLQSVPGDLMAGFRVVLHASDTSPSGTVPALLKLTLLCLFSPAGMGHGEGVQDPPGQPVWGAGPDLDPALLCGPCGDVKVPPH